MAPHRMPLPIAQARHRVYQLLPTSISLHRPVQTLPATLPAGLYQGAMCTVQFWKSRTCGHRWLTIKKSCQEGRGFNNCPSFDPGLARGPRGPTYWAPPGSCPEHDMKDEYDGNTTRMITHINYGVKLGSNPHPKSKGVEIICCSVM